MSDIRLERIYTPATPQDGFRILVDRVWPRGVSKEHAALDLWLKEVAPSTQLRESWGHDPATWPEFAAAYEAELSAADHAAALATLREAVAAHPVVTILYGAHDTEHNQAVVLRAFLLGEPVPGTARES